MPMATDEMLIDRFAPDWDASRIEHLIVPGDPGDVYEVLLRADFLRAWRESRVVRLLFALRGAGERTVAGVLRKPHLEPDEPEALRLADLPSHGDWVLLAEDPPDEIAFGVVGRFWGGETIWERIDAAGFSDWSRPGFARIACNFSLRPYGQERTLITYEARTTATDDASRRAFGRYWRLVSPFVGIVMRSMLRVVEGDARRARGAAGTGVRS